MPSRRMGRSAASTKSTTRKSKSFDEYYSEIYGCRWPSLRKAMLVAPRKVALYNKYCQLPFSEVTDGLERVDAARITQTFQPTGVAASLAEGRQVECYNMEKPRLDEFNIRGYYILDYASALVVEHLRVGPFDKVLDMCAAPGGKSIAIAQFLSPDGELVSNEASGDRCARLRRNLLDHIPVNYVPWSVTQRKAETWYAPATYNRVLVDAPCSSERHLLLSAGGNAVGPREWTEATTVELARLQVQLLQRAIETCAQDGCIVYSTCSISPLENDGVVAEALRRTRCAVEVEQIGTDMLMGEATEYGWMLMPDTAEGWGPMYFCVLKKIAEHRRQDVSSDDESECEEG